MKTALIIVISTLLFFSCTSHSPGESESLLKPFVLPYDDGTDGITHVGNLLNHKPAGSLGPVYIDQEGHFSVGGERIRFWGVNITAAGCFPSHEDAEKVAARLAKFGVNVVRFHHMEQNWSHRSLIDYSTGNSRSFNRENLDRLDYFIYQLKLQGIYSNLNLLTSREFERSDGLPSMAPLDWKQRHVLGFLSSEFRDLEKEHARNLLTHENPYTGLSYAQDPAIAIVEINNENGIIQQYFDGGLDLWPLSYERLLEEQWNDWLQSRYSSHSSMEEAWGMVDEPLGDEMLLNGDFSDNLHDWRLEGHMGARAQGEITRGEQGYELAINIYQTGTENWHVQLNQPGLQVREGQFYTLSFMAKSQSHDRLSVSLMMNHEPWESVEWSTFDLSDQWRRYELKIIPLVDQGRLRVNFGEMGLKEGVVNLAQVSLRPGGSLGALEPSVSLEEGNVPVNLSSERYTHGRSSDWMAFLTELEENYWRDMRIFLKEELRIQGLPGGTIASLSPPSVQGDFGFTDSHAYWRHPHFPGVPWDRDNWTVERDSMVNTWDNTLSDMAYQRILGMPFTVSEYQHSLPNPHMQESAIMIAAYAALQDWDGVYFFTYEAGERDNWDNGAFTGFFQSNNHPGFMVNMAAAANMFRRGDVQAAESITALNYDEEVELELLSTRAHRWNVASAKMLDPSPELAFLHRVAMDRNGASLDSPPFWEGSDILLSQTKELLWNLEDGNRGFITVNTPETKALLGYVEHREFDLGAFTITMGDLSLDWATLVITAQQGSLEGLTPGTRALIAATGAVENSSMGWTDDSRKSLGRNWGQAPTLVETIPFSMEIPVPANGVQAWILDEQGQREKEIPVYETERGSLIEISNGGGTLWYELFILPGS